MKPSIYNELRDLRAFLLLWSTQALSELGSAMTGFALVIWSYQQRGSALTTALLSICSYTPYVLLSIFAGALSDRWDKRRTLLVSDSLAALCTAAVALLLWSGRLEIGHLYAVNALNGLMNTVQQPASDVAVSLLTPPGQYQRAGGLRALSNALVTMLAPLAGAALLAFGGLGAVLAFDLGTFAAAFLTLLLGIRIPEPERAARPEPVLRSARQGIAYLRRNRGILDLILFLALINLTASVFNAALPALLLSRPNGGEAVLGLVNALAGLATLAGSVLVSLAPAPKSRVRVICNALLVTMGTENFLLAFGRAPAVWYLGAVLGWIAIPFLNANMDALLRSTIPIPMQGRVYAARNTLQFFTIPVGYLCGGVLIDRVLEPLLAACPPDSVWTALFGAGKGSGAAALFAVLGLVGVLSCLPLRRDRHIWSLEGLDSRGKMKTRR